MLLAYELRYRLTGLFVLLCPSVAPTRKPTLLVRPHRRGWLGVRIRIQPGGCRVPCPLGRNPHPLRYRLVVPAITADGTTRSRAARTAPPCPPTGTRLGLGFLALGCDPLEPLRLLVKNRCDLTRRTLGIRPPGLLSLQTGRTGKTGRQRNKKQNQLDQKAVSPSLFHQSLHVQ